MADTMMNITRADLELARWVLDTDGKSDPFMLCNGAFHVQQAIVKTLESYLIHANPAYDPTHDLRFVIPLFSEKHEGISDDLIKAVRTGLPALCKWHQIAREDLDEFPSIQR